MSALTAALTLAAPIYNLVLVGIVLFLFSKLFREAGKRTYLKPWKLMFAAVMVFVVEEVLTVLRQAGLFYSPVYLNGFFELVIVSLVIYLLLLQKQFARTGKK